MNTENLCYIFTDEELKQMALFFRKNECMVPNGLGKLKKTVEKYICNSMSIDEAEVFFNENS